MNSSSILSLSLSPDSTWNEVLNKLLEPPAFYTGTEPNKAQKDDAIRVVFLYNLALHWVVKLKWDKRYKIPYPRKVAEIMKPFGNLLYRYAELCIQCHGFLTPNPYPTSASWFGNLIRESQVNTIFKPHSPSKTKTLKDRRQTINIIVDAGNPISKQDAPHEWQLIETSLKFDRGTNFDKDFLKPFIQAYRGWLTTTDSGEWSAVFDLEDELYTRLGKGKGKTKLDFQQFLPFSKDC